VRERHPQLYPPTRQRLELEDETGQVHVLVGRALAVAQLPAWPNLLFFDSVYEWTDSRGRVTHCTYQEVWHHTFQQLVKGRYEEVGEAVSEVTPRSQRRRGRPLASGGPGARERILQSARQLFSELGYERTSLTEIAERAGLTRPAINYHFRSKESLYAALLDSTRDGVIVPGITDAARANTLPSRLAAFLEAAVQADSRDRSYARFIAASLLDAFRHPELRDRAQGQVDELRAFVQQALREAIRDGQVREDINVPAVTEMLIAVMWGMGLYAGFVGTHDQLEAVVAQFERLLEGDLW
jgi:AcrR family transcriptional regulator